MYVPYATLNVLFASHNKYYGTSVGANIRGWAVLRFKAALPELDIERPAFCEFPPGWQ